MVMLVTEPGVEERLIAERQAAGIDHHDEVWEGVYVVSPIANNEHQKLIGRLTVIFQTVVDALNLGQSFPGVNVSDQDVDWRQNYRVPDVAVFLTENSAQDRDTHWFGGPDFAVEIVSAGDRSLDKLPFYAAVGVRELLVVDRAPWSLELFRIDPERVVSVVRSTIEEPMSLESRVLPLKFRLVPGIPRPQIEITHHDGRQQWLV
jgi:Uma2 family endonuclease